MTTFTPLEWFHSLNNFLNNFYDSQCKIVKATVSTRKKGELNAKSNSINSVRKVPSTIRKSSQNRKSSLTLSTPLKDKSPNSSTLPILSTEVPFTPKPSQLSTATPFTDGRSRRTAATKADKYIDIVSRRLAEVPANGSTPKSMKIASKLISDASPKSRRNILLSQTLNQKSKPVQSTPISEKSKFVVADIPAETPATASKRGRPPKSHQIFQTPLISLASAAIKQNSESNSIETLSPSNVNVAPSTISRSSKLSQVHVMTEEKIVRKPSPVKETLPIIPTKAISPVKSTIKTTSKRSSPAKEAVGKSSPVRRSPRVSPMKIDQSAFKDSISVLKPQMPSVAATPKAPVVEFVAPQSVLRSSKRPRKQAIFNDETSSIASPAMKKQTKLADPSILPTVSVNSQPQIKITPQLPATSLASVPVAPPSLPPAPPSARVSNVNVPAIIVPPSASKLEDSSSAEDLNDLTRSSRRTPLRVQPAKTPTRAKAVIPSLSDYSAATKIAVIEVAKNLNSNFNNNPNTSANTSSNTVGSTPKVEPWTSKFVQKDIPAKTALNINVKPVDTSKISGFSSAAVPIVPKFPLNLANISNITKTSLTTEIVDSKPPVLPTASVTAVAATITETQANVTAPLVPPESPLTRAKRIDLENSNREEKLKTMMETKADKLKKAMSDLKSSEQKIESISLQTAANNAAASSSKLPVKPKANATVLPSPKIPSRLAEAFSGIDSELPPIDIGLVDDEKILKNVLNGASTKEATSSTTAPTGFVNPKMKKTPVIVNTENKQANNIVNPTATPNNSATQLHRTAVLNSAARKINESKPVVTAAAKQTVAANANLPSTPKPLPPKVTTDSSSPFLPEIHSDDELDKREKMAGKENRPTWAMTPNLTVALNAQRSQRAEDVFGKVQPIKLEDFFKGSGKKFPNRSSTSNWNNNI